MNIHINIKYYSIVIILLTAMLCNGQLSPLDSIQSLHNEQNYEHSISLIKQIKIADLNEYEKSVFFFEQARQIVFTTGASQKAYKLLLKAKTHLPKDSLNLLFKINDELIVTHYSVNNNVEAPKKLEDENCEIAHVTQKPIQLIICNYYNLNSLLDTDSGRFIALKQQHQSLKLAKILKNENLQFNIKGNIAIAHNYLKNYDSAIFYNKQIIEFKIKKNDSLNLHDLYNNIGTAYKNNKDYQSAARSFEKAIEIAEKKDNDNLVSLYRNMGDMYFSFGNFKKSSTSFVKYAVLNDSANNFENMKVLSELETKYQTAEKEKQLLISEKKSQERLSSIYLLSGAASCLLLIGGLVYNNQRKKKLLAQKEQELEKQRADAILKNQELATIDAMITGQEKERKRLAEELHDNLGSSLTTVKLYFENLKSNVKDDQGIEVYNRTEKILDDTYETIRSMSHNRHHGVMASKGLIPSIESLSNKITHSGKLQVEVIHHGLDKKLESSTELIIFRIVQELLSNVVKHAQATTAVINLTSYEDNLNIMIEDNGKGFDAKLLPQNDGMGLNSIEKRVEKMDGSFEVDSHLHRGTTINIDIPYYDQPSYS